MKKPVVVRGNVARRLVENFEGMNFKLDLTHASKILKTRQSSISDSWRTFCKNNYVEIRIYANGYELLRKRLDARKRKNDNYGDINEDITD